METPESGFEPGTEDDNLPDLEGEPGDPEPEPVSEPEPETEG